LKESAVLALLRAKNFSRSVLVTLTEWKADTYLNTSVIYDLSILILGADGNIKLRQALRGRDNLGGDAINPPSHSRSAVPPVASAKLESLFGTPEVREALREF
jgi:hypothetical protein